MTSYGIDPALSRQFSGGAKKRKPGDVSTFGIGDDLMGFESMIPGQAAVSGDLSTSLVNALQGQFPEEYFSTAIAGPLRRAFEQETLPGIKEAFVGPGTYWGTARAGEEVKGRTRMEEDISAKRAELAYQTQLQSLQAALAYLGIPLMAAYQPYEEGEGKLNLGATIDWGSPLQNALKPPKPTTQLVAGPGPAIPGGPTYQASLGFSQAAGNNTQTAAAPVWDPNSLVSKLAYWDYYNIPEEKRYPTIGEAIAKMLNA